MKLRFLRDSLENKFIRGLISLWIGDSALLSAGVPLGFDFFEQKTNDYYKARKTERLFEEIADGVLRDLAAYIDSEHRHLKQGEVKLIAESALDFLVTNDFFELCVSERMDPERIFFQIQNKLKDTSKVLAVRPDDLFSITKFIVLELLAILDSFPEFNRAAFSKILEDTELILDRLAQLETKIDLIDNNLKYNLKSVNLEYIRNFSHRFKKIKLFGIDTRGLPKNYNLSIAYINLTLTIEDDSSSQKSEEALGSSLIANSKFIVISGSAGSGKTTLLSWLALQASKRALPERLAEFNSHTPVFFRVRDYSEKDLPNGAALLQSQMGVLEGTLDEQWVQDQLKIGKFLILIDGFDEVTSDKREEIEEWIVMLGEAFSDSKFFITTRPYATDELVETLEDNNFNNVELSVEPMDLLQIEKFIDCWYTAYCDEAKSQDQYEKLRAAKERLKASLSSTASLRAISNNPLLCALICFVNADRDGFIPTARGELYSIAVETLLDRRERERVVSTESEIALTKVQKLKIMGYIASYFFERKSIQLPSSDVSSFLKTFLPSLKIEEKQSDNIVRHLTERSQVLRSPAEGIVDFSHKTFQEFFYARRAIDANYREIIAHGFFDEELSEVILFTCSEAPTEFIEYVLSEALENILYLEHYNFRSELIFLYSCVNETIEISPELRARISSKVDTILPPNSLEEAESLGSAGRGIIEPMSKFIAPKYKGKWVFCVTALIATFEEEAFPVLKSFAKLGSKQIDEALMRGKRFYESAKYNETVLSQCKTIDSLEVSDIYDMELLNALKNLESIKFTYYSDEIIDLNLQKHVKNVMIKSSPIFENLGMLKSFPKLEVLIIDNCLGIANFDTINDCRELVKLQIFSDNLGSISFLKGLDKLKELDVSESVNVSGINLLNSLVSIESVYLPYVGLYDSLNPRLTQNLDMLDYDPIEAPYSEKMEYKPTGKDFEDPDDEEDEHENIFRSID